MQSLQYPPSSNTWSLPDAATATVMFRCLAAIYKNEEILILTDGQSMDYPEGSFRTFLAAGASRILTQASEIETIFSNPDGDFWFGGLSYELKNAWHKNLESKNRPWCQADTNYAIWFCPNQVYEQVGRHIILHKGQWPEWAMEIPEHDVLMKSPILSVVSEEQYVLDINQVQEWIRQGLSYELNYCVEFLADAQLSAPLGTFFKLLSQNQAPFSAYFKYGHQHILCASPERFLLKTGNTLISQPIKGTARRSENPDEDLAILEQLKASEKDRAENIMIVDLVRNDLARVSEWGSTQVKELCGAYSFTYVHQLISTVQSTLRDGYTLFEAMASAFPMGSMTGAPKLSSMELIDKVEHFQRGLFSGTLGYVLPSGDADFNVVIRSLFYQDQIELIRFCAGGAITLASTPEDEWHELLLKTKGIRQLLQSNSESSF